MERDVSALDAKESAKVSMRLEGLLAQVNAAARQGDRVEAFRFADAAWRRFPKSPEVLRVLGRAAILADRPGRAVEALAAAAAQRRDPDLEADLIDALLAADRGREAVRRTGEALAKFAVDRGDRLAVTARRVLDFAGLDFGGWVGVSSRLELWGDVRSPTTSEAPGLTSGLDVAIQFEDAQTDATQDWRQFSVGASDGLTGPIDLVADGRPMLGAGASFPPAFKIDGRGRFEGGEIRGWVRIGWAPRLTPEIQIGDGRGPRISVTVEPDSQEPGRYLYRAPLGVETMRSNQISVSVLTPNGAWLPLPDSPVLLRAPPALPRPASKTKAMSERLRRVPALQKLHRRQPIDIVIPVYKGLAETLDCIASVRAMTSLPIEIVVIDDASPVEDLVRALRELARKGEITLLHNDANLGFPGAVNRGLELHPGRDVVVLNADAEVFPGWLEGLRAAAYSATDIATVTPLTNRGSIASYPAKGQDCSTGEGAALAKLAPQANTGRPVEAPTGVGFCMFIRRDCLDDIGLLDATSFETGYGEENDFCLRASARGWRHLITPQVFVRHSGGLSFGHRRDPLLERNLAILNQRYPGYETLIARFQDADPLGPARRALDEVQLRHLPGPWIVMITLDLPGGVERHVRERAAYWRSQGHGVLILRPSASKVGIRIETTGDQRFEDLVYHGADGLTAAMAFLGGLRLEAIEFHHFLGLEASTINALLGLGAAYDVFVHDYSWICTHITLLNAETKYCGEPALSACETCAQGPGARLGAGLTIQNLRRRSAGWLAGARTVIVPSHDVLKRLAWYFPGLEVTVRSWETNLRPRQGPAWARRDGVVRVAVIGAIGKHKGFDVLRACAADAAARTLPLEFTVIGFTEDDDQLLDTGKVFISGRYEEPEVQALIEREAPDAALFASIWPETWCYALSHALEAGLPVLAFDIGAIAERLETSLEPMSCCRWGPARGTSIIGCWRWRAAAARSKSIAPSNKTICP
jgi:GT2 family glycosyltransferase/glycosyltransferase involved in cell wall biosynthesis